MKTFLSTHCKAGVECQPPRRTGWLHYRLKRLKQINFRFRWGLSLETLAIDGGPILLTAGAPPAALLEWQTVWVVRFKGYWSEFVANAGEGARGPTNSGLSLSETLMPEDAITANSIAGSWRKPQLSAGVFASILLGCAALSALMASWLPLQVSIVTVFLFAGPHNWFEFRYFLLRLPFKLGKSRKFFLTAFAGIALLTVAYVSLPLIYNFTTPAPDAWSTVLASWNTLLLLWVGVLVWLRGRQTPRRDWSWAIPTALGLSSLNWLQPELFSLAIVYLHPLVALWFLDRHLRTARPEWLPVYHRCLFLLPVLLAGIVLAQTRTPALADDNGLFWRITQHAGAQLLPNIPARLLVSVHLFLEMLHYGVWLVALPLIAPVARPGDRKINNGSEQLTELSRRRNSIWDVRSVPVARHSRGFPKLVGGALGFGIFAVVMLWIGFSMDYANTRDIYFTVAIAHVVAEAPFLLRML